MFDCFAVFFLSYQLSNIYHILRCIRCGFCLVLPGGATYNQT